MAEKFTTTQMQRLVELNADAEVTGRTFETAEIRNQFYRETEACLVKAHKEKIKKLLLIDHKPQIGRAHV